MSSDVFYIDNAGLVLAAPFLPHLFKALDFEGNAASASRAVHLLQWLVDGRTDQAGSSLLLNKILAGLAPSDAITESIVPSDFELGICEQLLRAMLANWAALSSISIDGLRETFLQREGQLQRREGGWSLRVQRKTLDVLVDQVPWGFAVVRHPWQKDALWTSW